MFLTDSYRQSLLMAVGTVANALLGLVFYILVAKNLGVSGFGQFSFVLGLGLLASELGDLGINASIIKFGAGENFSKIISFSLVQRVITFTVIFLVFCLLNNFAAGLLAVGLLLAYFSTQSLLARQKFGLQVAANILGNTLRLILLLVTPLSAIVVFFLGTVATFVVGLPVVIKNFQKFSLDLPFAKEVWRFSLPTAGSYSLASLAAKIDIPILYFFAGPAAVGLYSSAQKLTSVIPQISAALDSVFSPKLSLKTKDAFNHYLFLSVLTALGILLFIPLAHPLISLIYGTKYLASVTVLKIFLISFVPFFLAGPFLGKILYFHGKATRFLIISAINFGVSLAALVILTGLFKENGAAAAVVLANTTALILYAFTDSLLVHQTS